VQGNVVGRYPLASGKKDDAFLAGNLGANSVIASRNVERQGSSQVDGLAVGYAYAQPIQVVPDLCHGQFHSFSKDENDGILHFL
jgi:hypothetical protein